MVVLSVVTENAMEILRGMKGAQFWPSYNEIDSKISTRRWQRDRPRCKTVERNQVRNGSPNNRICEFMFRFRFIVVSLSLKKKEVLSIASMEGACFQVALLFNLASPCRDWRHCTPLCKLESTISETHLQYEAIWGLPHTRHLHDWRGTLSLDSTERHGAVQLMWHSKIASGKCTESARLALCFSLSDIRYRMSWHCTAYLVNRNLLQKKVYGFGPAGY